MSRCGIFSAEDAVEENENQYTTNCYMFQLFPILVRIIFPLTPPLAVNLCNLVRAEEGEIISSPMLQNKLCDGIKV